MRVLLLILSIIVSFKINASNNERLTFSECRFSIVISDDWHLVSNPSKKNKCQLEIQNPKINGSLTVALGYDEFLKVASENGFDYFNNSWVSLGRQSTFDKATFIRFTHWEGLKGTMAIGCHNETGGYVGMCPYETAVLRESDTPDGAVLIIKGRAEESRYLEEIYKTLAPEY
ncbi:hypothetical protein [Pseudoalteromonas luteoviolacea]|uniref:hypothetical protein n=1 Tax=Pseudoalteromonas luteoviolacea TaxID=43657 RepID=UPI00055CE8C2|nr:hypothetical protein [Pseudoalteromonas luteoviolacea]KZN43452.1 hypothetical protein N483_09150 [Pseudoalteromonas luteoviolacea NCIMB 1944]